MAEQSYNKSPMTAQAGSSLAAVLAFAFGMSAGAIAGMLLTPRSGQETREQMKQRMQEAREKAMTKMDEKKDRMRAKMDQAKDKAKQTADDTREQIASSTSSSRRTGATPAL